MKDLGIYFPKRIICLKDIKLLKVVQHLLEHSNSDDPVGFSKRRYLIFGVIEATHIS